MTVASLSRLRVARLAVSSAELRNWALFALSVLAVFALQPTLPIRQFDFWLPMLSLGMVVGVWAATSPSLNREALRDGLVLVSLVLLAALARSIEPLADRIGVSRAPHWLSVAAVMTVLGGVALALQRWIAPHPARTAFLAMAILGLLAALKFAPATQALSAALRWTQGQSVAQASALDMQWLGFSYIAFRLVHALRERATGKLPTLTLREFVTYAVFFPTLIAGPIDRAERFVKELRATFAFNADDFGEGMRRIAWGLLKKFVLADSLAVIALNDVNANQVRDGIWAWVMLYAFALRIFLDFSGYTDIAIGVARLFGVKLPENFNRPYLKPNLTQFWNSWHMTLAQWFRAYYFNPLTRALRQRGWAVPLIIAFTQLSTMLLIGLWHGITPNFAIWGLWHGAGLFVHNRWAEWTKAHWSIPPERASLQRLSNGLGALLTFHYVVLGWVWFALSDTSAALRVLALLLGWQQ